MNISTKQKEIHRHSEQTCGCQREGGDEGKAMTSTPIFAAAAAAVCGILYTALLQWKDRV